MISDGDDPEVAKELIIGGAIVDARNFRQFTPLHMAVAYSRNQIARELIARGASIEAIDNMGRNAVHVASHYHRTCRSSKR